MGGEEGQRASRGGGSSSGHVPASMWWRAVWLALAFGLAELAIQGFRRFAFGSAINLGPQTVWLTPLAYLILFLACTAGLWALWAATRRGVPPALSTGLPLFLGAASLLLFLHPRLHAVAALLLALGFAARGARIGRSERFARLVRATTPWMAVVILALAVGLNVWLGLQRRQGSSRMGPPPADAPSLLLIILDTVRADRLGVYGYDRPTTPNLDRLAREGILYERAVSTSPWTLPSHASAFTGLRAAELSANWRTPLEEGPPTVAEVLRRHGYATVGVVANLIYCSAEHGLQRGFTDYVDYRVTPVSLVIASRIGRFVANSQIVRRSLDAWDILDRKPAADVNAEFLSWLDEKAPDDRPFFAFLNYFDAHIPYMPPEPYDTLFGPTKPRIRHVYWLNHAAAPGRSEMTPEERRAWSNSYDGALASLDREVGRLLDELRRRGRLDDTIVLVTSDHGEQFGDHGLLGHGNSLYMPLLHVPLIAYGEGLRPGTTVTRPVSLRDLPATLLELAGADRRDGIPGRPFPVPGHVEPGAEDAGPTAAFASVRPPDRLAEDTPLAAGEMFSLVRGEYHYIRNGDGTEELYRLTVDPHELTNLATRSGPPLRALSGVVDSALAGDSPSASSAGSRGGSS